MFIVLVYHTFHDQYKRFMKRLYREVGRTIIISVYNEWSRKDDLSIRVL